METALEWRHCLTKLKFQTNVKFMKLSTVNRPAAFEAGFKTLKTYAKIFIVVFICY